MTAKAPKTALVLLTHHKPYLMMSTLISCLLQDDQSFDLVIIFNEGNGENPQRVCYAPYNRLAESDAAAAIIARSPEIERRSYQEYDELARSSGLNSKLSPFDERLRDLCRLKRDGVKFLHYENDHGLDAGAWIKFLRSEVWKDYDYVFMAQEGTLLTGTGVLRTTLDFMRGHGVHALCGAHMKGRLGRDLFYRLPLTDTQVHPVDRFHADCLAQALTIFARDPAMKSLIGSWPSDIPPQRQFHVVDFDRSPLYRLLDALDPKYPLTGGKAERRLKKLARMLGVSAPAGETLVAAGKFLARSMFGLPGHPHRDPESERIYCDYQPRFVRDVVDILELGPIFFHRESRPEWFGCAVNHVYSRTMMEMLDAKFKEFGMYDIIDLPFSATALEILFGFFPAWVGVEKWFFDGYHRVTKNKVTKERQDTPNGLSAYLNRYYAGHVVAYAKEDYVKLAFLSKEHARLRQELSPAYF